MKVLITGVAGFLGTHVAEYFKKQGWDVMGIDNLAEHELKRAKYDVEKSRKYNLNFLDKLGVDFKKVDCNDVYPEMFQGVDYIVHCAAQPAMTIALESPKFDMENNVNATVNMLEVSRKYKIPFLNCSSVHVYGNSINNKLYPAVTRFRMHPPTIKESRRILQGDITPLHASKVATELYSAAYSESYDFRAGTFRLTGMYGERQFGGMDHGWVANMAIRVWLEKDITIFGTDLQVRDILYAKDAAKAIFMWFERGRSAIYNIGGGMETAISIKEVLGKLHYITGKAPKIILAPPRFGDMHYFAADFQKAYNEFGWRPETSTTDGLIKLVDWIKVNGDLFE